MTDLQRTKLKEARTALCNAKESFTKTMFYNKQDYDKLEECVAILEEMLGVL